MASVRRDPATDEEFLAQLYKGGELLAAGKVNEAKDHLERAYSLHPKNEKAQNLLGLTYFKLGLFERASEIYELLVNDNPVDPTLRVNLGLVFLKSNALQRAIREFETATDLQPDHKKAHNYLGLALAQAGDYARAREHFVIAGSDAMAEKMGRAMVAAADSPPMTVTLGGTPPSAPRPEPAAVPQGEEAQIEVMSDEDQAPPDAEPAPAVPRSDAAALVEQAQSMMGGAGAPLPQPGFEGRPGDEAPVASAPAVASDWGGQVAAAPGAPADDMRFAEDEGPTSIPMPEGGPEAPTTEAAIATGVEVPTATAMGGDLGLAATSGSDAMPLIEGAVVEEVQVEMGDVPAPMGAGVPEGVPPAAAEASWGDEAAPADPAQASWGEQAAPADPAQASWGEQAAPADTAQASWGEQAAPADPAEASWGEQAAPVDPAQASWGEQAAPQPESTPESWSEQQGHQWSADSAPVDAVAPAVAGEGEYSVPGYGATGGYETSEGQAAAPVMPEYPPSNEQDFSMVVPGDGSQAVDGQPAVAVEPAAPQAEPPSAEVAPGAEGQPAQVGEGESGYAPAAYDPAAFEETVPPVNTAHAPEYASSEAAPGAGGAFPSWLAQGQAAVEPPPADPYAASLSNAPAPRTAEAPAGYSSLSVPRLADLGPQLDTSAVPTTGPFHVGKDGLAVTVAGEMLMRLDGVVAVVGTIDAVPERRKMRGRPVEQTFGEGPSQMQRVKGHGVLHLEVGKGNFQAIELADEGAYLREERVFAFEESVSFENGRLTADGLALDLVHLKGQGRVLLKLEAGLKAMALPPGAPLKVPLARLVGWYGHVTPRLMGFVGQGAVELTGDGYALLASG